MASETAKKVAGTFVEDSAPPKMPVLAWAQIQCRSGVLAEAVRDFCRLRTEPLDPSLVIVDAITPECIHGHIPCRIADHESPKTFLSEVAFRLDPSSGRFV